MNRCSGMRILYFLLVLLIIFPATLLAKDMIVTLQDGRNVLLKEDGTWSFIENTESEDNNSPEMVSESPLSFLKADTKIIPKNPEEEKSKDKVRLILHIKNNTSDLIKKWKTTMTVKDPFGEQLFKVRLTSSASNINPLETKKISFDFKDDPKTNRDPYDILMIHNPEVLDIELTDFEITS
jgi:hypothetical protein